MRKWAVVLVGYAWVLYYGTRDHPKAMEAHETKAQCEAALLAHAKKMEVTKYNPPFVTFSDGRTAKILCLPDTIGPRRTR
jgi:hypothetical protein